MGKYRVVAGFFLLTWCLCVRNKMCAAPCMPNNFSPYRFPLLRFSSLIYLFLLLLFLLSLAYCNVYHSYSYPYNDMNAWVYDGTFLVTIFISIWILSMQRQALLLLLLLIGKIRTIFIWDTNTHTHALHSTRISSHKAFVLHCGVHDEMMLSYLQGADHYWNIEIEKCHFNHFQCSKGDM